MSYEVNLYTPPTDYLNMDFTKMGNLASGFGTGMNFPKMGIPASGFGTGIDFTNGLDFFNKNGNYIQSNTPVNLGDFGVNQAGIDQINLAANDILGQSGVSSNPFADFFNTEMLANLANAAQLGANLFGIYGNMEGLDLAKKDYALRENVLKNDVANNANLTNERLATRQAMRLRSRGLSEDQVAQGVNDFMSQYGVSGKLGG